MQIPWIWSFWETRMTRTPHHSKKEICRPQFAAYSGSCGRHFILWRVHIGRYASFVSLSLLVVVIAFSMPFSYTCVAQSAERREHHSRDKKLMCAASPAPAPALSVQVQFCNFSPNTECKKTTSNTVIKAVYTRMLPGEKWHFISAKNYIFKWR